MRKILHLIVLSLLVVAIMVPASCTSAAKDIVSGTGTVNFINLEGGFYGIISDDGENYDPINLSRKFQKNCLPVWFEAKIRDDIVSSHMWGTAIEITKIEKLGGG